ncbi:MAG: hypothetical protein FWH05_09255 [Oscillospiraceae bacterium]|nr:hypothetical protein [Oscillospiraceae bacterium]
MRYCPKCNSSSPDGAMFCAGCGERIEGNNSEPSVNDLYPSVENNIHYQTNYGRKEPDPHVSVGDWMLTVLIMGLPIVGLVMLFVWAFGNDTKVSKANFAKASLIWMGISIVLAFLFGAALMGMVASFSQAAGGYF